MIIFDKLSAATQHSNYKAGAIVRTHIQAIALSQVFLYFPPFERF